MMRNNFLRWGRWLVLWQLEKPMWVSIYNVGGSKNPQEIKEIYNRRNLPYWGEQVSRYSSWIIKTGCMDQAGKYQRKKDVLHGTTSNRWTQKELVSL